MLVSKAASIDSRSRCFTGFVGIKVDTQDLDVCTTKLNPLGRDARPRGRLRRRRVADGLDDLTLDVLREAESTLEDTVRLARRVLGGEHPTTVGIEGELQNARAALRAREETPPSSS